MICNLIYWVEVENLAQLSKLNSPELHISTHSVIQPIATARNLGILFDSHLSFDKHLLCLRKHGIRPKIKSPKIKAERKRPKIKRPKSHKAEKSLGRKVKRPKIKSPKIKRLKSHKAEKSKGRKSKARKSKGRQVKSQKSRKDQYFNDHNSP